MPHISRYTPLTELPAVAIDTETTGLDVHSDRLVQIGAVRVCKGILAADETFEALINPGVPIPPASTAIHGIDDAAVASAGDFAAVWPALLAFIGDAILVGQSIGFDLAILIHEAERIGRPWQPPPFLDTKLLAAALAGDGRERDLDQLVADFGIVLAHRHAALDDATATAAVYGQLLPRLAAVGILTLGDAEAYSTAQTRILRRQADAGWYDATSVRPADPWSAGRDRKVLAGLDPFLFRHRLRHVMHSPPQFLTAEDTALAAAQLMAAHARGAVIVGDAASGRAWGIVTESDLLRALARHGATVGEKKLQTLMSEPLVALPGEAFLYRALGRMARLRINHVGVSDARGRIVGVVSARDLLREQVNETIRLGEALATAETPAALAEARCQLPSVAEELLADGVDIVEIAQVLSVELLELMARTAVLAERAAEAAGDGRPPATYALLLLGSAGRGESLLTTELPAALVYAASDPEGTIDAWFGRFSQHVDTIIAESGVCPHPEAFPLRGLLWRGSLAAWQDHLAEWKREPALAAAEPADVFLDARLAYGDPELAEAFLQGVQEAIPALAPALAATLPASTPPALAPGKDPARVDLKRLALMPLIRAARVLAARGRTTVQPTPARLSAACSVGNLLPSRRHRLDEALSGLMSLILRQQIEDWRAGQPTTNEVDLSRLAADDLTRVNADLQHIHALARYVSGQAGSGQPGTSPSTAAAAGSADKSSSA